MAEVEAEVAEVMESAAPAGGSGAEAGVAAEVAAGRWREEFGGLLGMWREVKAAAGRGLAHPEALQEVACSNWRPPLWLEGEVSWQRGAHSRPLLGSARRVRMLELALGPREDTVTKRLDAWGARRGAAASKGSRKPKVRSGQPLSPKNGPKLKHAGSQDVARIEKLAQKALENIRFMQEIGPSGRGIVEAQPKGPSPELQKRQADLKAPCGPGGLEGAHLLPSRAFSPRTPVSIESAALGERWMLPIQRAENSGDGHARGVPSDMNLARANSMPDPLMSGDAWEEELLLDLFDFEEVPPPLEMSVPFPRDLGDLQLSAAQLLGDNSVLYPKKTSVRTLSGPLNLEDVTAALLRYRTPPGQHRPATN